MPSQLYVATRKGLFMLAPGAGGWKIEQTAFLGVPVSQCLPVDGGPLYAALNHGHFGPKLQRSDDGGASWKEIACPAFPEGEKSSDRKGEIPASLKQIWTLEAGGAPGEIWAGCIPAGLFHSTDGGESWNLIRSLWDRAERKAWFGGGYDEAGIHSVCVNPKVPHQLTLGVSCGGVWYSGDGGEHWECRATGMRAEYMPPEQQFEPNIQDSHRLALCAADSSVIWAQHHNGIFASTDGAKQWNELKVSPSTFGFAVAAHPKKPGTAWFVPAVKDETRVAVDGRLVVTRTDDGGKTFRSLAKGLPQHHAYDLIYRHGLAVDGTGELLAMGSTTGNLWLSDNGGEDWKQLSGNLPPVYAVRFG